MSKFYKFILLVILMSNSLLVSAQQDYWSFRADKSGIVTDKAVARISFPKEFRLVTLNIEPLRQELFTVTDNRIKHTTVITLPGADGNFEQFEVNEASNFEPALQARFPEIRAFSGRGITDKSATLKLSISPQGIQTMVFRTNGPNEYIEPYSRDHIVYAVFKSQRNRGELPWVCSTPDQQLASELNSRVNESNIIESNTGELKTMRLAQSCNGEYSNWFGAFNASQVALVLAAFNATLTRCNGCYEKDLAIHLNLVAETVNVIFYDPATDPYTTLGNWNTQLQVTLNTMLTGPATPLAANNAAYDIGHMFGASGGGGNAGCIGCVCVDGVASGTGSTKGRGITSPADGIPQGDNFDIDYVAHEVGHQMGGNHTFTFSNEGTQAQKGVGADITIMGYAGITSYDPAPHSIDIFHEASIQQIQVNMATKTCPVTTNITADNATPVVNPQGPYTIPISTPFALTGSASDPNPGDVLTYCWEQNDVHGGQTGSNSVAYAAKPTGPNWLTFPATTSPTRLFPKLSTVLAGLLITPTLPGGDPICNIEALSSVTRTLNFRLTVRDNVPYSSTPPIKVGQTNFTNVVVNVTNAAGPFAVSIPNGGENYPSGSIQTVTWNVNGTNGAPINAANVQILLSTDGGNTFPTVLLASTPNDGSESVTFPAILTTTARIKIEAIGNIFFDISNANFTLAVPPAGFNFNNPPAVVANCPVPVTMTSSSLTATYFGGFTNNITLSASGIPPGTNVTFSTNPLTTGSGSTTVSLNNANILAPGSYTITVTGVAAGAPPKTQNIVFTINPVVTIVVNTPPADQTVCAGTNAPFAVSATGAITYQWQVSTNGGASYSDIAGANASAYTASAVTLGMNGNLYRCIVSGFCTLPVTSNAGMLTVIAPVSVGSQPAGAEICSGSDISMSVSGTSTQPIVYQWQESINGGASWNNVTNGGVYSGATTTTLTITGATTLLSNNRYRCLLSNAACTTPSVSGSALLVVHQLPAVGLSAAPLASLLPGQITTLTATPTASTGGALSYSWYLNGSAISNSGNTRVVTVQQTGDYQTRIRETWPSGLVCSNQSAIVSIKAGQSPGIFIFPSPNDGNFTVSYFNVSGADSKWTLMIYDMAGVQVYNRQYNVSGPYTLMPVDLQHVSTGIYMVFIGDVNGKIIAQGKAHIH
ncbi:MAG: peptidase [Sphingobacteriales bacterium]|nr:peptidase [Sphingobacteriales bacterium]